MQAKGVEFVEGPREENHGTVAVFKDLYGNCIDLIQPTKTRTPKEVVMYCLGLGLGMSWGSISRWESSPI